ncbi:hypothetical protein PAXRUDRAFT_15955 [Paxillus rubicundulus Ve08.2h10]|uniref:Uncharacterized protein n=1 Tax=Paxillus rubicundulus Ve08.2h10 TaxID=930991 RepID=A0A0D0CB92_9AGAM|nr:hypothetical protein PAXRUDRAFT_15955 [Paxillus rubicundulus Ve08.2h10]
MELNFLNAASKTRQPKLTNKAKAALGDEAANASKKHKVDHNHTEAETKKARVAPSTGDGKSSSASVRTTSHASPARTAAHQARVTTKKEDSLSDDNIEVLELAGTPDDASVETAEEQLKRLTKEWTSPIYAFFNPTPLIVEINDHGAHDFECTWQGCNARI